MSRLVCRVLAFSFLIFNFATVTSWAWYDKTHIAIAKAAGYKQWYNAAGADIAKVKAGTKEGRNHFYDNDNNEVVSAKTVLAQSDRYNRSNDKEGHLYGAIIASLREFRSAKSAGKFADYQMAFSVHYIGDLSQPLHNISNDRFNKRHHAINDGMVENEVLDNVGEIQKKMYEIKLRTDHFDEDLAREIARIANISYLLGLKLKAENRDMTIAEAYAQLGQSASLLKAVLKEIGERD